MANAFQTFDYGNVVSTGENVLGARQANRLAESADKRSQSEFETNKEIYGMKKQQFSQEQQLENTKFLTGMMAEISKNPQSANYWVQEAKNRGVMRPDFTLEGKSLEEIQSTAAQAHEGLMANLQAQSGGSQQTAALGKEILENGNIGVINRDGTVTDTGVKARGFAQRPLETDAGVYNYNPNQGGVSPIITQDQISQGAAQKAGAVTAAQETSKSAVEKETGKPKAQMRAEASGAKTRVVSELIDQAISQTGMTTAGVVGGSKLAQSVYQPSQDLSATLISIQSNLGLDKLQEMKESSPNGSALGSVTEAEHRLLQSAWGAVSQSQSAQQLKVNLARVKRQVKESWDRISRAYEQTYGEPMPDITTTQSSTEGWSIQQVE